jgi:hypothetical protein
MSERAGSGAASQRATRPNAVATLVDADGLPVGTEVCLMNLRGGGGMLDRTMARRRPEARKGNAAQRVKSPRSSRLTRQTILADPPLHENLGPCRVVTHAAREGWRPMAMGCTKAVFPLADLNGCPGQPNPD